MAIDSGAVAGSSCLWEREPLNKKMKDVGHAVTTSLLALLKQLPNLQRSL